MVMPTTEHRERLVAGGCDEELADAILGVAVAVRDEAVEEAVARAMEQVAHSAGLLNGRIDAHDEKNESQFQVIESTIREIASQIRTEIADLGTQTERRITDLQTEMGQRFTKLETETERRFTELEKETGQRFTELEKETGQRFTEIERRFTKLETENERRFSGMEGRIAKLEGEIAALRAEGEANYARLHSAIHRVGFGLAGLVIAVTGVVVGILAATGAFS